jgi:hypothetical protein
MTKQPTVATFKVVVDEHRLVQYTRTKYYRMDNYEFPEGFHDWTYIEQYIWINENAEFVKDYAEEDDNDCVLDDAREVEITLSDVEKIGE